MGGPTHLCFISRSLTGFSQEISGEKNPPGLLNGKRNSFQIHQSTVFEQKVCPLDKLFTQSFTDGAEGKYPSPVHSSHPIPPKGEEKD